MNSITDLLKKLWASKYITWITISTAGVLAVLNALTTHGISFHWIPEITTVLLGIEKLIAAKPTTITDVITDLEANKAGDKKSG